MTGLVAVGHFRDRARSSEMPLDNLVTVGFQADRSLLRMRLEAERAARGEVELDMVFAWLEIVMSRLPLLQQGEIGALVRGWPEADAATRALVAGLRGLEQALAAAPDDAARIELVREAGAMLQDPATRIALAAVQLAAEVRVRQAEAVSAMEARLGLLVAAALAAALGLFFLLGLQARKLRQERQAAEAASRAKTVFLANMSHELRTPLNGVLGMLDLLADEPLPPRARERAATAQSSAQQLLAVIGDILDITKLEAGRVELERVVFRLGEVLRRSQATFAAAAEAKGVALRLEIAGEDLSLLGDPTRLGQVVNNLLANAVKFTAAGEVTLAAEIGRVEAGLVPLVLRVQDTGIGIPPAALPTLFDSFTQADTSTTRRYGGTGLGLAICREIVQLAGGTIEVESRPGLGTTFLVRLRLPLVAGAKPAAIPAPLPAAPAPARAAPHVLLVEDDGVSRLVAAAMLRKLGATVVVAEDGGQALERAAGERFDLVLMDIQMPDMDGLEVTRRIRAGSGPNARTRIVALSANGFREDVERSLEAGLDDHAAKPVSREVMERLLEGGPVGRSRAE